MRLGLIISNDWELFGDGSGDYFNIQHEPLKELRRIIENHAAKLTVMADVGQQWAHQRIAGDERWARDVVEAWETILQETVRRNHDVQLHIHPQWIDADYKNKKWQVNLDNWSISGLPRESIGEVLRKGKLYLDEILKPIDSTYECIAFRAGDYCIEPSGTVIEYLLKSGIICDTSVTKGMVKAPFFDYRDAYSNLLPWFASRHNIKYQDEEQGTLLEIPIYSYSTMDSEIMRKFLAPWLFYLLFFRIKLAAQDRKWLSDRIRVEQKRYAFHKRPFSQSYMASLRWWLSKIIARTSIQLDYDVLPPKVFIRCIEASLERRDMKKYTYTDKIIPVMATGHVKRMHNGENIDRILGELDEKLGDRIVYWTLGDAVRYWIHESEVQIS